MTMLPWDGIPHISKIRPGLRMPYGSSARLRVRMVSISSAVRPYGNESVMVRIHEGRSEGARFW